jgi:hypothetical protein
MTVTLTKEQIRARIDYLECAHDVQQAMNDVEGAEWEPGEAQALNLSISTREHGSEISFVNNVPPSVVNAGLRAMEQELMRLADVREVV